MKQFSIVGSHGTLIVDESGTVVKRLDLVSDDYNSIVRVDWDEYTQTTGLLPQDEDILCVGLEFDDGTSCPADDNYRERVLI